LLPIQLVWQWNFCGMYDKSYPGRLNRLRKTTHIFKLPAQSPRFKLVPSGIRQPRVTKISDRSEQCFWTSILQHVL
jgi:hypothetical protein